MVCIPEARARWNPPSCRISPASAASEVKISPRDSLFFFLFCLDSRRKEERSSKSVSLKRPFSLCGLKSCLIFFAFSGLFFCCHTTIGEHSSVISQQILNWNFHTLNHRILPVIHNRGPAANKLSFYSVPVMIHKMLSEAHLLIIYRYSNIRSFSIDLSWSCIFIDLSVLTTAKKSPNLCPGHVIMACRLLQQWVTEPGSQTQDPGWLRTRWCDDLCLLLQSLPGKFPAVIASKSWGSSLIFVCLHRARGQPCDQEQRIV